MTRRLPNSAALLSSVLLLAVLVCGWAGRINPVHFGTSDQRDLAWHVGSHMGRLSFGRTRHDDPALGGRPGTVGQSGRWGFYLTWSYWETPTAAGPSKYGSTRFLIIPAWAVALPLAVLPAVSIRRALRRRRTSHRITQGRCPRCGYDLRATPGCCPECGREAACVG